MLSGGFDILTGSDADHFLEHIGEMALSVKPCFDGRLRLRAEMGETGQVSQEKVIGVMVVYE